MAKLESSLILSLIDRVSAPARKVSATVSRLNDAAKANRRAMEEMQGQVLGAVGAGYALYRGLAAPVNAAVGFESAMADIAKVTDFSADGLNAYGKELRAHATSEIPMAVNELAALSAEAAAAGFAQEDLLEFTRLTAKAAVAWGVSGAQAGEDLAKLQTALGMTVEETQKYADAINHISDNTASTAPNLITFAKEVAVQGEFFGFSKEQTLAFGSAMISACAEANVAGTSFRNMGRALTKGTSATTRQQKAFKRLGMDAAKVASAMQEDAVGTTLEVIDAIGRLPAETQAAAISDLFGDEAQALIPLLGNIDLLKQSLGLVGSEMAYVGSVGREFENRAARTEFAIQRFKNQVNDLGITVGSILLPPLNDFLAVAGPLALRVAELAEAHPDLTRNVLGAAAALIGLRVAAIGLKFLGLVGKGGVIDLLTLGTKGLIEPLGKVRKELGLISALASTGAFSGFETLAAWLGAVAKVVPGLSLAGPALGAIVTALAGITLPVAAGIAAVAGAGFLIYKYWNRIGAFVSGFASAMATELQPALDAIRPVLDWFAPLGELIGNGWNLAKSALDGVGSLLSGLFSQEQLTPEQEEALRSSGRRLAEALVGAFSGVGQMLSDAITGFNWVQTGIDLMNAIWKGMKSIASKMVADLANQIASINPFGGGGGGDASGPRQVQPGDKTPGGDVIGGAFAKGGRFNSGVALVGEEGPELVEFGGPGNVHTAAETRGILGGAGGSGVGSITIAAPLIGSVTVHNMADVDRLMNEIGQKLTDMISGIQADTGYRVV